MADFNQVLTPGNYEQGEVNTVIEIPKGSTLKIEWDREHAAFTLDRVEPAIFAKPVNYGFIPGTIDEDGDELDSGVVGGDDPVTVTILATDYAFQAQGCGTFEYQGSAE